jgi:hypothetical protein
LQASTTPLRPKGEKNKYAQNSPPPSTQHGFDQSPYDEAEIINGILVRKKKRQTALL